MYQPIVIKRRVHGGVEGGRKKEDKGMRKGIWVNLKCGGARKEVNEQLIARNRWKSHMKRLKKQAHC